MAEESFLDLGNLEDVPELTTVVDGEYELQLTSLEVGESGQQSKHPGDKYLMAKVDVVGKPTSKSIVHVMMLPTERDGEKQKLSRLRAIKNFYKAFKIPTSGPIEFNSYIGNTGWALLREEESDDPQYGMQNRVRRFSVGA